MKRAVFLVFSGLLLSAVCAVAAPAAPKAPSDDDKEGTIAGTAVPREKGGFIGVELKDGTFRVTFYNEKKKPVPADKASAVLRWPVHYQPNNERSGRLLRSLGFTVEGYARDYLYIDGAWRDHVLTAKIRDDAVGGESSELA